MNPPLGEIEHWLPVVGYEGSYEVSDLGRVRSLDRYVPQGDHRKLCHGQMLQPGRHRKGHLYVRLGAASRGETNTWIHHLVLHAFVGPRPPGLECRHLNGNPADNRVCNLKWGTASENVLDKQLHGTDHESNKTRCPAKHLLKPPNLVPGKWDDGHRTCRACARARSAAEYAARCGRPFDLKAAAALEYRKLMSGDFHERRRPAKKCA